jgi:molybdopterin molybdotransferase
MNDESGPDWRPSTGAGERAVAAVRDRIAETVGTVERTETLPVGTAIERPLANPVTARRPLPHYDRAAVDGVAVAAAATRDASPDRPVEFGLATGETHDAEGDAVPVDAGDDLPGGTDAVVPAAAVDRDSPALETVSDTDERVSVTAPVEPGANVEPAGSEFEAGETVFESGRRLRPSDPALCVTVGRTRVEAVQRPAVGIVPTGDGLVAGDPDPGEAVETNGRTLSALVERWGGKVTYRDAVETDPHALRAAVERDLTKDLLVTTGGTGAGSRDRLYDVLADLGEVHARGVALDPGGTAGFAVVRERPVVVLPGHPVGCLAAALALAGPAVSRLAGRGPVETSTTTGRLTSRIDSERGTETVVPVAVERADDELDAAAQTVEPLATPATATRATVARADGWVTVAAESAGAAAGETVTVAAPERPL